MKPPVSDREERPRTRSARILGLLAAVGFSLAMWAVLFMAVLGLILKIMGENPLTSPETRKRHGI